MGTLVLLRHGKSDWSGGEPDHLRPLAPRGRRQVPEAGRWLADNVGDIDLAIVSPAERTRETWRLAAAELDVPPPGPWSEAGHPTAGLRAHGRPPGGHVSPGRSA